MVFTAKDVSSTELVPFFVDHLGYQEDIAAGDIAQYFADVKTRLADGPVEWHGLGTFTAGATGVQFKPADQWINYINPGFDDIIKPAKDDDKAAAIVTASTASTASAHTSVKEPIPPTNYRPWIWLALGLISFLVAMFFVIRSVNTKSAERAATAEQQEETKRSLVITSNDTLGSYAHKVNHVEASSSEPQEPISSVVRDEEPTPETEPDREAASTTTPSPSPIQAVSSPPTSSRTSSATSRTGSCVQVMGAFGSAENAKRMHDKLSKYGDDVYMKRHGNLYRVGVIGSCDRADALQRELQSAYDIKPWGFALK